MSLAEAQGTRRKTWPGILPQERHLLCICRRVSYVPYAPFAATYSPPHSSAFSAALREYVFPGQNLAALASWRLKPRIPHAKSPSRKGIQNRISSDRIDRMVRMPLAQESRGVHGDGASGASGGLTNTLRKTLSRFETRNASRGAAGNAEQD